MMALDSTPPDRGRFSHETLSDLERALGAFARGEDDASVGAVLTRLSVEARERAIPPEEVLVALKATWHALPMASTRAAGEEQTRQLQRVVTMCIKAYYR